jgi:Protein of unknown function (DUF1559)
MISIAGRTSTSLEGYSVSINPVRATLSSGPATDFGINPFLNSPPHGTPLSGGGTLNAANAKVTLPKILDGTSNTILFGEMYCATANYRTTTPSGNPLSPAASTLLPIFVGGTGSTSRSGTGANSSTFRQDGSLGTSSTEWGSPMSAGALFSMADGSVHLIPYNTNLTDFLYPNDGTVVELP